MSWKYMFIIMLLSLPDDTVRMWREGCWQLHFWTEACTAGLWIKQRQTLRSRVQPIAYNVSVRQIWSGDLQKCFWAFQWQRCTSFET
jgi:hypothetical protein